MARILIVDDDAVILEMIKDILTKYKETQYKSVWELDITTVTDPVVALSLIEEHNFELIITDILMAKLDGWELIRQIRKKFPQFTVPIVVISAIQGVGLEYESMKHGASAWFHKPL
ncbi:MAG: response regulator, partial [Chloroflexi bacterium]|nr:response regulator [Chloroflexota bacterium]